MVEAALRVGPPPWREPPAQAVTADRLAVLAGEILERCRGEGPPNCVASCPLGVDARTYLELAREGAFVEALAVVRERLPFPGILGHVCTHPCELHCKRLDEDSAVRIRDVKRFLAEREEGEPRHDLRCQPERGLRVAVVGAGPAGLLAAHDLRRVGFAVTLLERDGEIGGCLVRRIPPWRLPRAVIARDLSIVAALGIEVRTGCAVGKDISLAELRRDFAAVALLTGFTGAAELLADAGGGLRSSDRGTVWADPTTCETGVDGVFAAAEVVTGPATVVEALALGRRAASSLARYLLGEEAVEPAPAPERRRLPWSLDVDEAERKRRERTPILLEPGPAPLSTEQARAEAARCLGCRCQKCVDECDFLTKHCASPRELARRVTSDLETARTVVYSCSLCSLCAVVCPEKLDTGALMLEARREAVRRGLGPLPQHRPALTYFRAGVSRTFSLVMAEPGRRRAKRLFFTGCLLPAVSLQGALRVYDELRRHYPGTGVLLHCCGAPVASLGLEEEAAATASALLQAAEGLGAEELITACPDCARVLRARVPELRVRSAWEALAGRWRPAYGHGGERVAILDTCASRDDPAARQGLRELVRAGGAQVEEVAHRGEMARCCGMGGMVHAVDPELFHRFAQRVAEASPHTVVTACAWCRMAIASRGKEAVHIADFLLADEWRTVARGRPTGRVTRLANRLRAKLAFRRLEPLGAE